MFKVLGLKGFFILDAQKIGYIKEGFSGKPCFPKFTVFYTFVILTYLLYKYKGRYKETLKI